MATLRIDIPTETERRLRQCFNDVELNRFLVETLERRIAETDRSADAEAVVDENFWEAKMSPEYRGKSLAETFDLLHEKLHPAGPLSDEEMMKRARRYVVENFIRTRRLVKRVLLDTNILVRRIRKDDEEHLAIAEQLFADAAKGHVELALTSVGPRGADLGAPRLREVHPR